jgi:hypothetical protein
MFLIAVRHDARLPIIDRAGHIGILAKKPVPCMVFNLGVLKNQAPPNDGGALF